MLLGGGGTKSLKGARREGEIPRDLAPKGENPRDLAPGGGGGGGRDHGGAKSLGHLQLLECQEENISTLSQNCNF